MKPILARVLCGASAITFALPARLPGQSVSLIPKGDSALLIVRDKCQPRCPDSSRVEWRYAGHTVLHVIKRKGAADTTRLTKVAANIAQLTYTPYWLSAGSRVATTPPVVAPDDTPVDGYVPPVAPAPVKVSTPAVKQSKRVNKGDDLQAALNSATGGTELVLANGAIFTGNYTLPVHSGGLVIVRAETVPTAPGVRTSPEAARSVAKIITPNSNPALQTAKSAANWRIVGLELAHGAGAVYNYGIVVLGWGNEPNLADQPNDIVLDRVYIHGSLTDGTSRCVAFNGRNQAVIDSYLADCHAKGNDAQGVGGWNGQGPFLIENNRIEASAQGVMFGGADPVIANLTPSDITIRRNYFLKPLEWRGKWTIKTVLELKHAKRVLFEGNVIENCWIDAQTGYAILFQSLSQYNNAPWNIVSDVMVRNNRISNTTGAAVIASRVAYGGPLPLNPSARIAFVNNLFQEVGRDPFTKEASHTFQIFHDIIDFTMLNNTVTLTSGNAMSNLNFDGPPTVRLVIRDNVFQPSSYGGGAISTFTPHAPDGFVMGNVFPGQEKNGPYPASNTFTLPAPPGKGVNRSVLNAAVAGVVR